MNTLASFKLDYHHRLVCERSNELWLEHEVVKDAVEKYKIILRNENIKPQLSNELGTTEYLLPLQCHLFTDIDYFISEFKVRIKFDSGGSQPWQNPVKIQQLVCDLEQGNEEFKPMVNGKGLSEGGWAIDRNDLQKTLPDQNIKVVVRIPDDIRNQVKCLFKVYARIKSKLGLNGEAPLMGYSNSINFAGVIEFNNLANL